MSYDVLHASLLSDKRSQALGARLSWEESARVWIQSLINYSLAVLLFLKLPQCSIGVVGVWTRGHKSTVAQDLGSRLPGWEQHFVFEL